MPSLGDHLHEKIGHCEAISYDFGALIKTGGKEINFLGTITGINIRITTAVLRKDVPAAIFNVCLITFNPKEVPATPTMKELIRIQDETDRCLFSCINIL